MTPATLIRAARTTAGLTQGSLARRVGVSRSSVVRWELGVSDPSWYHVHEAVESCGCELHMTLAQHGMELTRLLPYDDSTLAWADVVEAVEVLGLELRVVLSRDGVEVDR